MTRATVARLLGGLSALVLVGGWFAYERLRPTPLFRERYHVAFAPGHRYEKMNAPMREFEGEPYVKRLHCEFPANFAKLAVARPYQGVRVRYVGEREDWVQAMVAAGLGMTLMPEFLPILPGIAMRLVVEPEVHREVSLVTVAGRPHAKPVALAVGAAKTFAWERAGAGAEAAPEMGTV